MPINSQELSKEQALSKERVLIVGCGDIGQRFARHLPAEGYEVTGLRRHPPIDLPYLRYRYADATDSAQMADILKDDYAVILISMTPSERSDTGYQRAYVQTCEHIVEGLRAHHCQPRLVMFVSSTAVYHQMDGEWIDELSPTEPDTFSGKRLLEAEQLLQASGFPVMIARFSGIYGPGRRRLIEQVKQQRASASTHFTNRIHADDGARALAHLVERQRTQHTLESLYLVTDSAPAAMLEVVSWLAEQLSVRDYLSAQATNERGNKRCSNQRLLDTGFKLRYADYKMGYSDLLSHEHEHE